MRKSLQRRIALLMLTLLPIFGLGQLPSSGPISIDDIQVEAPTSTNNLGTLGAELLGMFGVPISLSDFYDYDGDTGGCSSPDLITGTLKYDVSDSDCDNHIEILGNRYGGTTFANASGIFTDTSCTPAASGYYSNGSIWKYWDSTTKTFTSSDICGL